LYPRGKDKKITLFKGKGCKACKRSGYTGRMGIFEVLVITDEIRELILKEAAPMTIKQIAQKTQGLKTIRQDALSKKLGGLEAYN
jgi:type IV pilus assembly protein PilB